MRYTELTDIGLKRDENQDMVKCEYFGESILAVVCDGMGGERAGREASSIAIEEFFQRFKEGYDVLLDDEEIRKLLIASISAANSVIYTKARFDYKNFGMGTTCVAAFVNERAAYIANVGDSRAYAITNTGLCQITEDHNMAALLYEQGKITEEELVNHPQKNMLIRAVGVEKTVLIDTFILDYEDTISLLLCSDGLSGYSSDDEIYDVIVDTPFECVAEELVKLAYSKGGRDNITVALITD
ncbi:MAG: Stp1/IreP family PP2C-type Ser/Thr phosphatase [Ruminococcus sp.]|nr:Stp1/IreP family PP2C-type Ser/Thr phosphatase [Ruminococcus sp.]CDF00565.1 serine/threonine protein phosphatase [Ruminococcus sp. CAG:624]MCI6889780.1 Stp1/IreP family PP2C-type Ser/Thr phosphatase [Ruminococcus sp.]MDD6635284.1 Stp1/IreP family PP2C-type Ser/Thr phosphatase [Ruminococcus sp.]MDY3214514.1 Stp1/IreP family PP2C-type Ser/Thr phosphatase [Ruminococcus sp.]